MQVVYDTYDPDICNEVVLEISKTTVKDGTPVFTKS